ncbi:MAG: PrsW family glutamic-type intramembrane protease [Candidatus Pacebacteria bacterium]|nr:PrsW family glutamic-type intramembrane protease [Candidatus Paceibacterota bacterium]
MTTLAVFAISVVLGLLPGFAWLAFYLSEDPHAEPRRLIVFTFVAGMAFGFFTVAIESGFTSVLGGWGIAELSLASLFGLAVIEELMKFAAAHFAVTKSPQFREPIDAMIYMIVAALGFATIENIGALAGIPANAAFVPAVFETMAFRFVGATLLHTLTSGIIGYYWALGMVRGKPARHLIVGFAIAAVLHTCFNYLILNYGNGVYTLVFLVIVGFFVLNDFEALKAAPEKTLPADA